MDIEEQCNLEGLVNLVQHEDVFLEDSGQKLGLLGTLWTCKANVDVAISILELSIHEPDSATEQVFPHGR